MSAAGIAAEQRMRLVFSLRKSGVTNQAVLEAIEATAREVFVEETFGDRAFDDTALPIACGQTISQPSVVGVMTQALAPTPRCKVLEIGTGSGYQAAVLARLCRRLYSIERHATLAALARERLESLSLHNVTIRHGDGALGWPGQAPFDRIMVTAAAEDPPGLLVDQLKVGGIMVAPIGDAGEVQKLLKITKTEDGLDYNELIDVRFVPLLEGLAKD